MYKNIDFINNFFCIEGFLLKIFFYEGMDYPQCVASTKDPEDIYLLLLLFVCGTCAHVYEYEHLCAMACMWRSEDLIHCFYHGF